MRSRISWFWPVTAATWRSRSGEKSIRVPLIVRGPGVPAGETRDHYALNIDLAPTFAELGGAYLAIIGGTAALETTWVEAIEDVDLDDLNPESLWKFRVRGFGPLVVAMDSHGGSLYDRVRSDARGRRAQALASLGVKSL